MTLPNRCLMVCALLLACAWASAQPWPDAAGVAALIQSLGAVAGVGPQGPPVTYTRDNLKQYGGSNAERVLLYDYKWTVASAWRAAEPSVAIAADVYCFGSPLEALGAFSIDRKAGPGATEVIAVPGQVSALSAYWSGTQLHVWRGPLYLRVVPASEQDGAKAPVLALASAILEKLPRPSADPAILGLLPERGLLVDTVKYHSKNALGLPFLRNSLAVTYGDRRPGGLDVAMQLLLMDAGAPDGAQTAFTSLQTELAAAGPTNPAAALGEQALAGRHPRYGQVYAMRQGRYLAIAWQVGDPRAAQALLRDVAKNIRTAK